MNYELEIPNGTTVQVEGEDLLIKGKLGSTRKRLNSKFVEIKVEGNKITLASNKNKKLAKKAELAAIALNKEIKDALKYVNEGLNAKMKVLYAHFPMSIDVKGKEIHIKNIFGEKIARTVDIVGDTKVEVKGQELFIKGVDKYDVGQTIANIRKGCYSRGNDTRVFQDGLYISEEE